LKCELANAAVPTAFIEHPGRTDGARTVPGRRVLSGNFWTIQIIKKKLSNYKYLEIKIFEFDNELTE
jgi:hypothetical protein